MDNVSKAGRAFSARALVLLHWAVVEKDPSCSALAENLKGSPVEEPAGRLASGNGLYGAVACGGLPPYTGRGVQAAQEALSGRTG